ncbi:MAG: hypothetical protein AAF694_13405 [Bacteroidota bacterium]
MEFSGKVVRIPVSGGSWGIEGDDGQQYRPVNGIPKKYQTAGARVRVRAEAVQGMDIFMWGRQISISSIQEG